jgi:hypothetical protein
VRERETGGQGLGRGEGGGVIHERVEEVRREGGRKRLFMRECMREGGRRDRKGRGREGQGCKKVRREKEAER